MTPSHARPLRIGLLNNMPDAALEASERQFLEVLGGAGGCELSTFHIEALPRSARARAWLEGRGGGFAALMEADLDGIVVTGAEPLSAAIEDEVFYPYLVALADAALLRGLPLLVSCLAAHALAAHLRGVARRRLPAKLSGVFAITGEAVFSGAAPSEAAFVSPHSRWNDLDGDDLTAAGFEVVASGPRCGVDAFILPGAPGFLFLQGHPEYAADSLLLEYRRDLSRALAGTGPWPAPPEGYLPAGVGPSVLAGAGRDASGEAEVRAFLRGPRPPVSRSWNGWSDRLFGAWTREARRLRDLRAGAGGASCAGLDAQAASNTAAIPCPPPMHMVSRP